MNRILQIATILFVPVFLFSQDLGKLAGTVTDENTGDPLAGANVLVEGSSLGAATDADGNFIILGVPVDVYTVRAEFIGYRPMRISNVRVSNNLTTDTDFALSSEAVELGVVNVVAQRPLINPSATNAIRSIDSDQIANFATRNVADLYAIQAGVVLLNGMVHIRGSRPDEVGFEVEGASTKAIATSGAVQSGQQAAAAEIGGGGGFNFASTIAEALEEVSIQSGGYSADLGGSNAGIIQQKFKTGGSRLSAKVLYETDAMASSLGSTLEPLIGGGETFSYGSTDITATLGGPLLSNRIRFFGAVQQITTEDFNPQFWFGATINDGNPIADLIGGQTPSGDSLILSWDAGNVNLNGDSYMLLGDSAKVAGARNMRSSEVLNFNGTLLFDLNPLIIRVGGLLNTSSTDVNSFPLFRIFNDRISRRDRSTSLINVKGTMFLGSNTLLNVNVNSFSRLSTRYDPSFVEPADFDNVSVADILMLGDSAEVAKKNPDWVYQNRWTPPVDFNVAAFSFQRPGDLTWGYSKTEQSYVGFNGGLVSQMGAHELKLGADWRQWTVRRYVFGTGAIVSINQQIDATQALADAFAAVEAGNATAEETDLAALILRRSRIDNIGFDEFGNVLDGDGVDAARHPNNLSFYVSDKLEMDDIIVNAGLRMDQYNLDDFKIDDVLNPPYDQTGASVHADQLKPTDTHTILQPRLGLAFPLSDKAVFHLQYGKFAQFPDLGQGFKSRSLMALYFGGQNFVRDPVGFDLEPIITIQYEVGFTYQLGNTASIDITGFARNTEGQIVLEQVFPAAGNTYGAREYSVYNNGDFTTVNGIEFVLQTRRFGAFQVLANYTWTDARGTNSFPNSTVGNQAITAGNPPTMISPLQFAQKHKGAVNLDTRFGPGGPFANSGVNFLFTFNGGHPYTRSSGGFGQRAAEDGALLAGDPRQRQPLEPIGASTTPWVFNADLKADVSFNMGNAALTAYVIVTNLFNRQHELNVYDRSGNAYDDHFFSSPELSELIVAAQGPNYEQLYRSVNIANRQHWIVDNGFDLFGVPRQIKFGISVGF